jgi:hypothetical protein
MHILKGILTALMMVFVPLLLLNGVIYFAGCFIALDANPLHWLMFTTIPGRVIYTIVNIIAIGKTPDFWDSYNF